MEITNVKDLIAYLSTLYSVETNILEQEKLLIDLAETVDIIDGKNTANQTKKQKQITQAIHTKELNDAQAKYELNKAFLNIPKRTKPTAPEKPTFVPSGWGCNTLSCGFIALFTVVAALIIGGPEIFIDAPFLCLWLPVILLVISIITYRHNNIKSKELSERLEHEYAENMRKYEAAMKEYHEYEEGQKELKQTVKDAELAYKTTKELHLQYLKITSLVNAKEITYSIEPLLKVRKQLYDMDIIFPKYRNLPCVATMLEYLQSGRCSELEGPAGAYNLYESELRANLIISRLDNIAAVLEKIKNTQYNLYQSALRCEKTIEATNEQMKSMLAIQKDIAEAEHKQLLLGAVTASCAIAMESHTKAIKYLELID